MIYSLLYYGAYYITYSTASYIIIDRCKKYIKNIKLTIV